MSNALNKLIAQSPELVAATHRDYPGVKLRGTAEQLRLMHNLLCNYTHQKEHYSQTPHEPALQWITKADYGPGLAFIAVSMPNVRAAIKTFLYVNILLGKEVADTSFWDENEDEFIIDRDELSADKMADADADAFMAGIGREEDALAHA